MLVHNSIFFKCLTNPFLNTLLHRVSSNIFENHIANKMENDKLFVPDNDIEIKTELNMNDKYGPSIYISFYENNNRICHLTIHLCPTSLYYNSKGPIHIVNNTYYRATRRLRVKRRNNNTIIFSMGSFADNLTTSEKANKYTMFAIKVLNMYFNPNSKYYLGKDTTKVKHDNLNNIIEKKNKALRMLGKN